MADTKTTVANAPIWLDLSSSDAAASRDYYSKLFGWKVEVNCSCGFLTSSNATRSGSSRFNSRWI